MLKSTGQLLDTGLDAVKTASQKVVYKASKFIRNKTADTSTKSNDDDKENKNLLKK